jgi:hypothetical protein
LSKASKLDFEKSEFSHMRIKFVRCNGLEAWKDLHHQEYWTRRAGGTREVVWCCVVGTWLAVIFGSLQANSLPQTLHSLNSKPPR